jgi:hypothetical protein
VDHPRSCAASRPAAICTANSTASSTGSGPAVEPVGERLALDILEHEVPGPVLLLDAVDPGEVRVAQLREGLGFTLEAFEPGAGPRPTRRGAP